MKPWIKNLAEPPQRLCIHFGRRCSPNIQYRSYEKQKHRILMEINLVQLAKNRHTATKSIHQIFRPLARENFFYSEFLRI